MSRFSCQTRLKLLLCLSLAVITTSSGCCATGGWIMNNSGMGYYQAGNYAMARHEFAEAVAMAPWNPDYRHNLAMSIARTGDTQRAEQILRHNLTVDAMHQPTYHSLAKLMNETGRQPEAEQLLMTWAGTQPYNPKAHVELAWLQRESGDLAGAEQSLRQALQINPNDATTLAQLGQLYQDGGEPARAAALYQQSLALNYGQPEVQSRLATLQRRSSVSRIPALNMNSIAADSGTMMAAYPPSNAAMIAGQPVFQNTTMMPAGVAQAGWMPTASMPPAHLVQGGIPAGTYQVTPWQYADQIPAQNMIQGVAPSMMASPAPTMSASPTPITYQATPTPIQQVGAQQTVMPRQISTQSQMTVPAMSPIPAMPGAEPLPIPAAPTTFVAPMTVPVPSAPTLAPANQNWQPVAVSAPSTVPVTALSEIVVPASFTESAASVPTVEAH